MSKVDLTFVENNDPSVEFTLKDKSAPTALTGALIECYVKDAADDPDSTAIKYSTVDGSITILADPGKCRVDFQAEDVGGTNKQIYHLDVVRAGRRLTYAYGKIAKVKV